MVDFVPKQTDDIEIPDIPEDLKRARVKCVDIMHNFQRNRIAWYQKVPLKRLLTKDIAMFAARGVATSDQFVEEAFHATESSSEETVAGSSWQQMLSAISENTLDTGDLTTSRDGILWVCEVKSQTNTTNSSSFPQELRALRTRMEENLGRRRTSNQPVKAAYCVLRDKSKGGKGRDENTVFHSADIARENRDLDGFEYRYITGKQFWKWLTGYESEVALLMPLTDLQGELSKQVLAERALALSRLKDELSQLLEEHGLGSTINDVVKLRDVYL